MRRLRDPAGGCPWDREQDFTSIAPYTIEEAYEVADAIARGEAGDIEAELGDLLFQVVFHAQMGAERGWFDFASVADAISDKLTARHPHVFGDAKSARWANRTAPGKNTRHANARREASRRRASSPTCRWHCRRWRAPPSSANVPGAWASTGRTRSGVRAKIEEELREVGAGAGRAAAPRSSATCCSRSPTGRGISEWIRKRPCGSPMPSSSGASAPWKQLAPQRALPLESLDAATWDALWNEVKSSEKSSESNVQ